MKIENKEILVTKIDPRKSPKDNSEYLIIYFLDIDSGDNFQVTSRNTEHSKLKSMSKYEASFNLSDGKFGMRLELSNISEETGTI